MTLDALLVIWGGLGALGIVGTAVMAWLAVSRRPRQHGRLHKPPKTRHNA